MRRGRIMNKLTIGTIIALAISFGALQIQAKNNEKNIDKHEVKIEKTEEELKEAEIINEKQSIYIEQITENMNRQTILLDKLYDKMDK